jgi:hypothetical protein
MKSNRLLSSKEMTLEWGLFVLPYLQCMLKCFRFNDILNQASQIWHQSIHHHWFWTFYSLKTAAFHFMIYKKESYGCVNDPKLWSQWIRNWGGGGDHELSHAAITQRRESGLISNICCIQQNFLHRISYCLLDNPSIKLWI